MNKHSHPDLTGLDTKFPWADDARVMRVIAALEAREAGAARFVGGCVRDSLLGLAPKDIDIATPLTPDVVMAALSAAGLGVAPTGVEHGTVTAIADHLPVEVTSLRADVATDGRRATVAFTRDWAVDAARRDFTVNALYLTPSKQLFDPVGGVADLKARKLRFIGAAEDRIREDYLRILRFFRFSARFAEGFDTAGLAACASLKDGIGRLSAERIGDELSKLLSLPTPQDAVRAMSDSGVLAEIWEAKVDVKSLDRLKQIDPSAPPALALAALFGADDKGLDARLRLSNAIAARRKGAVANAAIVSALMDERAARAALYRMGVAAWRDAVLLAEALKDSAGGDVQDNDLQRLASLPDRWPPPAFPLSGKDVLAAGVEAGPAVAAIIRAAEARWIAEDFPKEARAREIFNEEISKFTSKC